MFAWFEHRIDPFKQVPVTQPPGSLARFYWHYIRQIWPVFATLLVTGGAIALLEVSIFRSIGEIIDFLKATAPDRLFQEHGHHLLGTALVVLIARSAIGIVHDMIVRQTVVPSFTNLIRWQGHRYLVRQSLGFFQNDFAGRLSQRVLQTGVSLRESVMEVVGSLWFVVVYAVSAIVLFAEADWRLTIPLLLWIAIYVTTLSVMVPRIRDRARAASETRSALTGRIVDSYTNITTVKLFAHAEREDAYVRRAMERNTAAVRAQTRLVTVMASIISVINCLLIGTTIGLAVWLWTLGAVTAGAIAFTSGLVIRIYHMSGWIMWVVTGVFENVGVVQEGMDTLARPHTVVDRPGAMPLAVTRGEIAFDHIRFHYGREGGVIDDLSLTVRPGERLGLVGRSGAGKSTLVSLLLRFHDLEGGRILIDGQDIAAVSQESLRSAIGVVTQDTSLLHRSVRDNIRYGWPTADDQAIGEAAQRAHADAFIPTLVDPKGRHGLDAHVGERGVKLSGGQRQRIAIARVLLKDAPVLVLDEATSALDSEVEAAIQEELDSLMAGKTVIAIAHRLSTIARMDRLIVMDKGAIVESGTHAELVARGGIYADLWRRQSGGFLGHDAMPAAEAAQ
ncbi:MAG: ABC transporter ATP-binding protein [Alphaproteobacteria bacterium]